MRIWGVLLVLCLGVVPCVAEIPWCGQQDLFFWNASSDIPDYRIMNNYPERVDQVTIKSPSVTASTGDKTVGTWLSPPVESIKTLEPGLWRFHTYVTASSDSGITTLKFRSFNRSSDGTITWLFFGNAFSEDINGGTVPTEYWVSYARRNSTVFFPGDRFGIQINVSTNSAASRLVMMDVAGNTNASLAQISYWGCPETETSQLRDSSTLGIIFGLLGGLIGGLIIIRGDKKL